LYFEENINLDAVFSDETENFRIPSEPSWYDPVQVIIRTEKDDVNEVIMHFGDYSKIMRKMDTDDKYFDYYERHIPASFKSTRYYFELKKGYISKCYTKKGIKDNVGEDDKFLIVPDFKVPEWSKGAVMYQIFIDRFYSGDPTNNVYDNEYFYNGRLVKHVEDWDSYPTVEDCVTEHYGGDLQGIINKLDYLKDLGVDVLYLNPMFVSPSNHKYDTQDYDYVDPHFGQIVEDAVDLLSEENKDNRKARKYIKRTTEKANLEASNRMFAKLVDAAHERGMKVILDGVFNHCGSFNKWLDRERIYESTFGGEKGAYTSKESPYNTYFKFNQQKVWPYNGFYEGWWNFDTLPKLNYEGSEALQKDICRIGAKWVSPPYNADGWRLDVAADLGHNPETNHKFWQMFRTAVRTANQETVILAEHYDDPLPWFNGKEWDTVMNYIAFMDPIGWFLTGMQKHSDQFDGWKYNNVEFFVHCMVESMSRFPIQSLLTAMNELSNHDHSRFLTRTNMTVGRVNYKSHEDAANGINLGIMREAVTIQMTWPGSPTIYYGDEAGQVGWTDPDNRRTYPWNNQNIELINFHRDIIKIRKKYDNTFRKGSLIFLNIDNNAKVLSYGRFDKNNKLFVVINNDTYDKDVIVPVWKLGAYDDSEVTILIKSNERDYTTAVETYTVKDRHVQLPMPARGTIVAYCGNN
jgi:alpha-glucosidase